MTRVSRQPTAVTHASGLHAVARELAEIHEETVRTADGTPRIVRLPLMTLVAVCSNESGVAMARETIGYLTETHSARAIIIRADARGEARIDADIAILAGRGDARGELVSLVVSGEPALHLASVAGPLLAVDRPVYVWMVGAPPLAQAFGQDAIAICERVVIDTGAYADATETLRTLVRVAGAPGNIALADVAWARTRAWRDHIAQAFDGVELRRFVSDIRDVAIAVAGDRTSAQGLLIAGWLATQLEWTSENQPHITITPQEDDETESGDIMRVRIECGADADAATVRVERHEGMLYTGLSVNGAISATRTLPLDVPDLARLVGSLMEHPREDPIYRRAAARAVALRITDGGSA